MNKSFRVIKGGLKMSKKKTTGVIITISLVVLLTIVAIAAWVYIIPEYKLNNALKLIDNQKYEQAYDILKELKSDKAKQYFENFEYRRLKVTDDKNNIIEQCQYDKYGNMITSDGSYDDVKGMQMNSTADGKIDCFYTYDSRNRCIQRTHDSQYSWYEYLMYDEKGKCIQERIVSDGGYDNTDYTYSDNGNLMKKVKSSYAYDGEEVYYEEFETVYMYNEKDDIILEKESEVFDGEVFEYETKEYKYEYDSYGNITKEEEEEIYLVDNEAEHVSCSKYTFDDNNNLIEQINTVHDKTIYKYTAVYENNKCIQEKYTYIDHEDECGHFASSYFDFEAVDKNYYDESGNLIKKCRKYDDGEELTYLYEYEILYIDPSIKNTTDEKTVRTKYFDITFPDSWINNYVVQVSPDGYYSKSSISFYEKSGFLKDNSGVLFEIVITDDKEYFQGETKLIGELVDNDSYYMFVNFPTDVQYTSKNEKIYSELSKTKKQVLESIKSDKYNIKLYDLEDIIYESRENTVVTKKD